MKHNNLKKTKFKGKSAEDLREERLKKRSEELKSLVELDDFTDKNSITYNKVMYSFIRVLETRISYDKNTYPRLNLLRNGLVHGYFYIDPLEVKRFILSEIDNLSNKTLISSLESHGLFNMSLRYCGNARQTRNVEAVNYYHYTLQHPFEAAIAMVEKAYLDEMQEQQIKILNFGKLKKSNREAMLYCIACFGEAGKQLSINNQDPNKSIMLEYCKQWRNEIFHDIGEKKSGELVFPENEIKIGYIKPILKIILGYDFPAKRYTILENATPDRGEGVRIQTIMSTSAQPSIEDNQESESKETIFLDSKKRLAEELELTQDFNEEIPSEKEGKQQDANIKHQDIAPSKKARKEEGEEAEEQHTLSTSVQSENTNTEQKTKSFSERENTKKSIVKDQHLHL